MILMAGSTAAGKLGTYTIAENSHLICKLQVERERLGLTRASGNSKPMPRNTPSPTRPRLLILPQTVPLPGNQTFKHMSLWGPFSVRRQHD